MRIRASRNRTLTCNDAELETLASDLLRLAAPACPEQIIGRIIQQDYQDACRFLPPAFVDLMILDPPYNLTKNYHGHIFQAKRVTGVRP